jgi:hypothetical protein
MHFERWLVLETIFKGGYRFSSLIKKKKALFRHDDFVVAMGHEGRELGQG